MAVPVQEGGGVTQKIKALAQVYCALTRIIHDTFKNNNLK